MSEPYLDGRGDRLRRHHREAGLHDRQPERARAPAPAATRSTDPPVPRAAPERRPARWRPAGSPPGRSGVLAAARVDRSTVVPSPRVTAVPIAVTGSIATDHLMHFPGRFADRCSPTSCTGCRCPSWSTTSSCGAAGSAPTSLRDGACSGCAPVLVGAVGADFADYRELADAARRRLRLGCICADDVQTARFVCTTDDEMNQIASFYAGAMARGPGDRARADRRARTAALDLVVIGADDPAAMVRHTRGVPGARLPVRRRPVAAAGPDGRRRRRRR